MSRVSRSTIVDVTYDDPRTGERIRERRVQEVPWDDINAVRERELALVRTLQPQSPPPGAVAEYRPRRDERDYDDRRSRYIDPSRAAPVYVRSDDAYDRRPPPRRDPRDYDDYDSDSSRERRRRRRRRREEREDRESCRAHSERGSKRDENKREDDGGGKLWYSMKDRREGNFFERNFDSSYDGLIAAAAGAAIGAITVRHFTKKDEYEDDAHQGKGPGENPEWEEEKSKRKGKKLLKTAAGALAGAAAFNAGENWYRIYTEEKEERQEEAMDLQTPAELMGQAAQEV